MPLNMEMTPFNIKLLQLTAVRVARMKEVKSLDVFDGATRNFHQNGLFSVDIFGRMGDKERMRNFSFIDIKCPILHPLVVRVMGKLKRIYPEILHGKTFATWDAKLKDFVKSNPAEGQTGFHFFMQHWEDLKLEQRLSDSRELNIKFIDKTRLSAINDRIIISPAGYRDYVIHADGREESDEVNELYYRMLSLANTLTRATFKASPESFDRTRSAMQRTFDAIYEYHEGIVVGKNKLSEGKLMSRQVKYGTRNTIVTQNLPVKRLFAPDAPTINNTGVGLFQYLKAYQPPCSYQIKTGYVSEVFSEPGTPANLVNPKTLRAERVMVPNDMFSMWMTFEGLNKLMNHYGEESFRHDEIKIGEYYFGLIYNDGKRYRIFNNIDQLPEGFDRKFVKPVTYTELFYDAVYAFVDRYIMNVTRFPVTGKGSIYPSKPLLKPTLEKQSLIKLNENFEEDGSYPIAHQFPVRGARFLNASMPSPLMLKGLGADFDGDKTTNMGVMMRESLEESHRVLNSRNFYVGTDGSISHSMATDTLKFLLRGMMRNPDEVKAKLVARALALESYREQRGSAFTSFGRKYDLNKVLAYIEKQNKPLVEFQVDDLSWVLKHDMPDPQRVANADVNTPIIVVEYYGENAGYSSVAVDGLHRVARCVKDGVKTIKGFRLTEEELEASQGKRVAKENDPGNRFSSPDNVPVGPLTTIPQLMGTSGSSMFQTTTFGLQVNPAMTDGLATRVNGVLVSIPKPEKVKMEGTRFGYSRSSMRNLPDDLSYVKEDDPVYVTKCEFDGKVFYNLVKGFDVYAALSERDAEFINIIVVDNNVKFEQREPETA